MLLKAGDVDLGETGAAKQLALLANSGRFTLSAVQSWMRRTRCREMIRSQSMMSACGKRSRTQSTCRLSAKRRPGARPTGKDSSSVRDVRTHNANDDVSLRSPKGAEPLERRRLRNGVDVHFAVWQGIIPLGEVVTPAIAGYLSQVGINARWDIEEPGLVDQDLAQHACSSALRIGDRMDEWRSIPLHDRHRSRAAALHRSGFDKPCQADVDHTDGPARLRLLAKVQQLFMQELPHVPWYYVTLTDVFAKRLKGYSNPKDGFLAFFERRLSGASGAFGRVESRMTAWGGCCV